MQTLHLAAAKPRRSTLPSGMFQANGSGDCLLTSWTFVVKEAAYIQELPAATPSALKSSMVHLQPGYDLLPHSPTFVSGLTSFAPCRSTSLRRRHSTGTPMQRRPKIGMLRPRLGSPIAFPAGASRLSSCLRFLVDGGRPLEPRWLPCSIPTHCNAC